MVHHSRIRVTRVERHIRLLRPLRHPPLPSPRIPPLRNDSNAHHRGLCRGLLRRSFAMGSLVRTIRPETHPPHRVRRVHALPSGERPREQNRHGLDPPFPWGHVRRVPVNHVRWDHRGRVGRRRPREGPRVLHPRRLRWAGYWTHRGWVHSDHGSSPKATTSTKVPRD